jgi:glutathione peroxidase
MKNIIAISVLIFFSMLTTEEAAMPSFYDFTMDNIKGESVELSQYKGKVILVVNTASKCGFTYQYDGLEELYQSYKESGLVILGFPANNFLKQEPGTNEEIAEFCRLNYGVTFPMFSKISVKGNDIHPLYEYLTSKETNPEFEGNISWNFNKFLISRSGKIIARFGSREKPQSDKIIAAIEKALNE